MTIRPLKTTAALAAAAFLLAACGDSSGSSDDAAGGLAPADDWDAVLAEADGQTVDWYMFGGDDLLNTFVADEVAPRLADLGVELNQVRIDDTADAVNKVLGEVQAGRTDDGTVDAIWINGENFATGVQADLWRCDWAPDLPNAEFLDADDPAILTDFGTPVDGCESPWQQANSALVYDSAKLTEADVETVDSLLAWVEANPGEFTYPAPPDFTGSMAIRQLLYGINDGPGMLSGDTDADAAYEDASTKLLDTLTEIAPNLWRGGETYPQTQADVEELFGDGEIAAYFTYGPGAVGTKVDDGLFPESTRQAVLAPGNIANVSFVTVPANAGDSAGGLVLANTLLDPEVQLALYEATGIYPTVDLDLLSDDARADFEAVPVSDSILPLDALTENAQPELASEYIGRLEEDWIATVLQGS